MDKFFLLITKSFLIFLFLFLSFVTQVQTHQKITIDIDDVLLKSSKKEIYLANRTQDITYHELETIYEQMTTDERIGQMLFIRVRMPNKKYFTHLEPKFIQLMEDIKPGGLIFFAKNIKHSKQIKRFIKELQDINSIPLFIASDIEGGPVNRFQHTNNSILADIPSAKDMSLSNHPSQIEEYAFQIGSELKSLGFNMYFAAVADIRYSNTPNFLRERIFGNNAIESTKYTLFFLKGQQRAGIISVMKHFPGHGGASGDTHFENAKVSSDFSYLSNNDFLPYKFAIKNNLEAVMLGHLQVPAIDNKNISTFSKKTINLLQEDLGFRGLIISDSLSMKGVKNLSNKSVEQEAFNTGVNILLDPPNPYQSKKALLKALYNQEISETQLKINVLKILAVKTDKIYLKTNYR